MDYIKSSIPLYLLILIVSTVANILGAQFLMCCDWLERILREIRSFFLLVVEAVG
jgi:hypothetical protein